MGGRSSRRVSETQREDGDLRQQVPAAGQTERLALRGTRGQKGHSLAILAHGPPSWTCPREPTSQEAGLR